MAGGVVTSNESWFWGSKFLNERLECLLLIVHKKMPRPQLHDRQQQLTTDFV